MKNTDVMQSYINLKLREFKFSVLRVRVMNELIKKYNLENELKELLDKEFEKCKDEQTKKIIEKLKK